MSRYRVRGLLLAALFSLPLAAIADEQDDAIAAACPGLKAWQDRMKAERPEMSDEAREARDARRDFSDTTLREELHRRFKQDQEARFAMMAHPEKQELSQKTVAVDTSNIGWMRPLFTKNGFPTVDKVGYRGVEEAFILVQHSDADPAFQASMLEPLRRAAEKGEVTKPDFAMLTDRVLRSQKRPQRYGSQYMTVSTSPLVLKLQPTEDEAHLDERRAAMDMMPRADYECALRIVYAPARAGT